MHQIKKSYVEVVLQGHFLNPHWIWDTSPLPRCIRILAIMIYMFNTYQREWKKQLGNQCISSLKNQKGFPCTAFNKRETADVGWAQPMSISALNELPPHTLIIKWLCLGSDGWAEWKDLGKVHADPLLAPRGQLSARTLCICFLLLGVEFVRLLKGQNHTAMIQ